MKIFADSTIRKAAYAAAAHIEKHPGSYHYYACGVPARKGAPKMTAAWKMPAEVDVPTMYDRSKEGCAWGWLGAFLGAPARLSISAVQRRCGRNASDLYNIFHYLDNPPSVASALRTFADKYVPVKK